MRIENIKADLHAHGWCGQEVGPGQFVMKLLGESGKRNLHIIAEKGFSQGQNTLIGLINFNDTRYQKVINTRKGLGKEFNIYDDDKERFVGVYNKEKELWGYVLRGQEIPTDKGHLLILGNNKEIGYRIIGDVLKEAEDMNALRVGDHILGLEGLGKENISKYRECIDMIEYCNSNFPWMTDKTEDIGKELMIPGLYNSDSHDLKRMFSSYQVFSELDFSNWNSLREGLKDENNIKEIFKGRNRICEIPIHVLAVVYNIFRQKIGIVKNPLIELE